MEGFARLPRVREGSVSDEICRVFGENRARLRQRNQLIGDVDLLIGATCLQHNRVLLTTNRRHFERIPGLRMISSQR